MPDVDLDFEDERRGEVIRYIAEKYGNDHVAQIITFGSLGARLAVRDVGRAMNIPIPDVDRIAKQVDAMRADQGIGGGQPGPRPGIRREPHGAQSARYRHSRSRASPATAARTPRAW